MAGTFLVIYHGWKLQNHISDISNLFKTQERKKNPKGEGKKKSKIFNVPFLLFFGRNIALA